MVRLQKNSIDSCPAQLLDFVLTRIGSKMHTGMTFVETLKNFDTLDLENILEKNRNVPVSEHLSLNSLCLTSPTKNF